MPSAPDPRLPPAELRARLTYDDARLLAECEVEHRRVRGPGGQHRNKVSSGVRLTHRPSGITVTASERRSQHENRDQALHRLREALALYTRLPLPDWPTGPLGADAPASLWPAGVQVKDGRLHVSPRNPALPRVLALVLDALAACRGVHQKAAQHLGLTPTSLTRFLAEHPKAWAEANRIRSEAGLPPLRA